MTKKVFIVYKYIYSYINSNTNMSKITSDRFHFVFLGEVNASKSPIQNSDCDAYIEIFPIWVPIMQGIPYRTSL